MSQTTVIKRHLKEGKTLTALQALKRFGCMRLAARIEELRRKRMPIKTELVGSGAKKYARYRLAA